jgi:subtilisin family serine protease
MCNFAGAMRQTTSLRLLFLLFAVLVCIVDASAARGPKVKYPGGRYYIWRFTLKDKQGSPYSIEHPSRWLSHRSIERRRRQGLPIDSTDLPVSNHYLKVIEKTSSEAARKDRKALVDWTIIGTSRWNNTVLVRSNDTTLLARIAELDFVKEAKNVWISPDSIERGAVKIKVHEKWNPWDSIKGEYYGNGKEQIEMVSGHRLHSIGFRGKGMTIAVLDGGFQNCDQIPAIQHINIIGTKDFVYPNSQHFYRETDHGTKVLSALAANEPQVLVGTAPEARYWLLRCEDQQSEQPVEEDYWAMAAEFADSVGADIINSSLGYSEFDKHLGDYRQRDLDGRKALISRTASMLAQKGIILVNSAGNSGMGLWKKINFPADAYNILTVGALNSDKKNAPFSGVGPTQDGRVKPDVMALGSPASLISGRGTIIRDMGTSFSTPIVAGLVACLWQALPSKNALELMELVRQTSNNYQEPDNIYGYGLPNFWRAYMVGKL